MRQTRDQDTVQEERQVTAVGDLRLYYTLGELSPKERERLADVLSTVAADMKKGATGLNSRLFSLKIRRDVDDSAGEALFV